MGRLWQLAASFLVCILGESSTPEQPALLRFRPVLRYGLGVGAVAVALAVTLFIESLRAQPPALLFFAAVILTSWYSGMRAGLLASILSILALDFFFVSPIYTLQFDLLDMVDFAAFAGATWLISHLQTRWRRTHRALVGIEQELDIAQRIQQRLFPAAEPALAGFDIAGRCLPANATGGDFFDYIPLSNAGLALVIGDVSGHGLGPALVMSLVHAYLRALTLTSASPAEILTKANRIVYQDIDADWFVTVFMAHLDPRTATLTYAGAGHESYLLEPSGAVTTLASTGLPLGVREDEEVAGGAALVLYPGQLLLLLSDGILEAESAAGQQFGLKQAVEVAAALRHRPAREIVAALQDAVRAHTGPTPPCDDRTVVVLKVAQPAGSDVHAPEGTPAA